MGETYNDRHDSKIYGARLIIYRRGDVENASFTFRAKIAGQKGYIRRNTKTDDPARAMVLAEQAYEELQVRKKSGLSLIQLSSMRKWLSKPSKMWLRADSDRLQRQNLLRRPLEKRRNIRTAFLTRSEILLWRAWRRLSEHGFWGADFSG